MFDVGDIAVYRGGHGAHASRLCRITGIGIEVGRVVYDNDLGSWGYAEQYAPATPEQIAAYEQSERAA